MRLHDPECCCGDVCTEFYCEYDLCEIIESVKPPYFRVWYESYEDCNKAANIIFVELDENDDIERVAREIAAYVISDLAGLLDTDYLEDDILDDIVEPSPSDYKAVEEIVLKAYETKEKQEVETNVGLVEVWFIDTKSLKAKIDYC